MTAVYAQLPDVDQQVKGWLDAVGGKLERRGVLGAIRDTTWLTGRTSELASFATVYARAWTTCALKVTSPPAP